MRAERFFAVDPGGADQTAVVVGKVNDQGQLEIERLFSLDTPSLQALSHILRHKEMWPEGFEWDFRQCTTCAMGLAEQLWREAFEFVDTAEMTRVMKMDPKVAICVFGGNDVYETYGVYHYPRVTPEMVADQIDKYLGTR